MRISDWSSDVCSSDLKEKGFLFSERRYGAFERDVPLPSDVNPDAIKAQFKDGVLTVTLAKDEKEAAHTRKITVEKARTTPPASVMTLPRTIDRRMRFPLSKPAGWAAM